MSVQVRIGHGYDVHRLAPGIPFMLGGIHIESQVGCVAHSDGDCLIHALCDAMLGALALGDIGTHFPDTSAEFKTIDSKILLSRTCALIKEAGYELVNADCTVCLQAPKIAACIPQMRTCLASVIGVPEDRISVKATTSEQLGFVGRKEGIAVWASCLLQQIARD